MTRRDGSYGKRIVFALLTSLLAHAMLASVSEGRPTIRTSFFAAYPGAVGTRLDNLPSITSVDEGSPITASRLAVLSNPFDHALDLRLELAQPAKVRLRVFDVHGRQVLDREYGTRSGASRLTWDGRDGRGETVRAGVYWAVVRAGDKEWKRQVVRIR